MFQSKRRRQASWRADNGTFRGSKSATRKIKLGWKHQITGSFKLIPASKGGGSHDIDAEKHLSLTELENKVCELYFPEGQNTVQDLLLSNLNVYLANFSGSKLQDTINGEPFTVELFYKSRKSHPIRVYLHTYDKSEKTVDEAATDHILVTLNHPNADEQEVYIQLS
ncbi:uncharacterized protein LOC124291521 [Haliotis rubra]|uniref:uncharacterized protein LOC124291521 n=1 Tax=Haliotis rubra TaxID=36100 RepID=UPI001EE51D61|nr:uncharacterized protein LOC124291521 [Haliotis rubra]